MPAPGGTVGPGDATARVTGGAAAVVVDTSRVLPAAVRSVKRAIGPPARLAEIRVLRDERAVRRHVFLDLPVCLDFTVRHVDVVVMQSLFLPTRRHVTRFTVQTRTPLTVLHVWATFAQRLVFLFGVHVNGLGFGFGFGITGVPPADAACTAGDAAVAGTALEPTTSSMATAAPTQRVTLRPTAFTVDASMVARP